MADNSMNFYDINKKLKNVRQNRFIFNQIIKLTLKISSSLSNIYIRHAII